MILRKKCGFLTLIGLLVFIYVSGCATMGTGTSLSTKGKAAMILSTYNTQAQQTVIMSHQPNLTEAQKVVVRKKKAIILKLDPMVKAYGTLVQNGGTPSAASEQAIYSLIDELVGGQ